MNNTIRFAAAALVLLCTNSASAGTDDFPLKRIKSFTWVVDYEASWSTDGKQIVLISSRHGGMKVHTIDANSVNHGSDMRQLTTGEAEDDSPSWSPDGKKIAFVSIRAGVSQIFVMNADGSDVRQLTKGNAENIHPTWSPDSTRILFNTTHFSGATAADGTDLKRITTGGGFTYASYSPDGMSILHRRIDGALSHLFIMNADASNDHDISGEGNIDGWPAWSSDGKRVVFSRRVKDAFQLFVMNRDGSDARQVTDATGEFVNPRWSPDGTKILCSRRLGDMTLVIFPAPK